MNKVTIKTAVRIQITCMAATYNLFPSLSRYFCGMIPDQPTTVLRGHQGAVYDLAWNAHAQCWHSAGGDGVAELFCRKSKKAKAKEKKDQAAERRRLEHETVRQAATKAKRDAQITAANAERRAAYEAELRERVAEAERWRTEQQAKGDVDEAAAEEAPKATSSAEYRSGGRAEWP